MAGSISDDQYIAFEEELDGVNDKTKKITSIVALEGEYVKVRLESGSDHTFNVMGVEIDNSTGDVTRVHASIDIPYPTPPGDAATPYHVPAGKSAHLTLFITNRSGASGSYSVAIGV